jgi:hypothetical protein
MFCRRCRQGEFDSVHSVDLHLEMEGQLLVQLMVHPPPLEQRS